MKAIKSKPTDDHRRMSKSELSERLAALQLPSGFNDPSRHIGPATERPSELQTVLHELEVYQIELEMQVRELQESRDAVEDSHSRYVDLYDFAPLGYFTLSEQGLLKEINLTAAGMLGVERQWLIERSLAPWILSVDLPAFRMHLKRCIEEGGSVKSTLRFKSREQRVFPVELATTCLRDAVTGQALFRTAMTDLTDRRKAEDELDRFFHLSADLLCIIGADGYFKRTNPAFERILGYSTSELLARPIFDFILLDDRETARAELSRLMNRERARATDFKNRYIKKNRGVVWISWNAMNSGQMLYCVGRDISDQVQEKNRIENQNGWLKEVIWKIPAAVTLIEAKTGTLLSMSSHAQAIFKGVPKSIADFADAKGFCVDSQGERLDLTQWPRMRAARGEELSNEVVVWQTPRGKMHLQTSSRNLPESYGHPAMSIMVSQDVTHLKKVEDSLHEAVETLKKEQDLRERFVAALSHDLRTPLTAAKMKLQLMARKFNDLAEFLRGSGRVVKFIERADQMIQDLLDANRIVAGEKLPIVKTSFDLVQLTRSTLAELSTIHGDRFVLNAKAPLIGNWSRSNLRRMIENIVGNAVKYGDSNRVITVSVTANRKRQAIFAVQNFGSPIPEAEQLMLFRQFHRSSSAEKSGQKGWGIGLTLVRGIVEAHGGTITVKSNPEDGTTFRVVLPQKPKIA